MPEVASQTLDFVGRELNVTLAEARTALENYVEHILLDVLGPLPHMWRL